LAKLLDFQNDALENSRRYFVLISGRLILSGGATTYLLRSPLQAGTQIGFHIRRHPYFSKWISKNKTSKANVKRIVKPVFFAYGFPYERNTVRNSERLNL